MLDTNILVSLLLFPNQRMNHMMEAIFSSHKLVLSSFVVEELKAVVQRKFPAKTAAVDDLLAKMSFDLVYTPEQINENLFQIRDEKDYPVLYTAMTEDVDILITGDKDFAEIEVDRPEILTPAKFIEKYLK
jgi:putative PIN family toxin of toxin-antitoxin system